MITIPLVYLCRNPIASEAVYWPDSSIWYNWTNYFRIAGPNAGMLLAEYWAYIFLAFLPFFLTGEEQLNMIIVA